MVFYYHYFDEFVFIRRFTSFFLALNEVENTISLKSIMFLHEVKTVEFHYNISEGTEAQ